MIAVGGLNATLATDRYFINGVWSSSCNGDATGGDRANAKKRNQTTHK
jgi:hypothetical protein